MSKLSGVFYCVFGSLLLTSLVFAAEQGSEPDDMLWTALTDGKIDFLCFFKMLVALEKAFPGHQISPAGAIWARRPVTIRQKWGQRWAQKRG